MSDARLGGPDPDPDADMAATEQAASANEYIDAVRSRWILVAGLITWLATIIAPAISFDVNLALSSDSGQQFQSFFLLLTAALFLIVWRSFARLPFWVLGVFAALSLLSFVAYSLAKDSWTCAYYPHLFKERLVMGAALLDSARDFLNANPLADPGCEALMENWGGDARKIWTWPSVQQRFLTLFGLYAFAWLMLALLVLGATRYSLLRWRQ